MPSLPPMTQALMLLNVGLYCLQFLAGGWVESWFALQPVGHGFWPWQVLTYSLLHGSMFHLAFNMFGLWSFGCELEQLWGAKRYVQFYVASVLAAAVAQLVLYAMLGSYSYTLGASGGLFGLLLAFGMTFPDRMVTPLIPPIPMKAKYFVALFGGLELLFGVTSPMGGVAHFAHLGGMLGGFLMLRYWRGQPPFGR
jgi:membrane associated rhomboid family serine protease